MVSLPLDLFGLILSLLCQGNPPKFYPLYDNEVWMTLQLVCKQWKRILISWSKLFRFHLCVRNHDCHFPHLTPGMNPYHLTARPFCLRNVAFPLTHLKSLYLVEVKACNLPLFDFWLPQLETLALKVTQDCCCGLQILETLTSLTSLSLDIPSHCNQSLQCPSNLSYLLIHYMGSSLDWLSLNFHLKELILACSNLKKLQEGFFPKTLERLIIRNSVGGQALEIQDIPPLGPHLRKISLQGPWRHPRAESFRYILVSMGVSSKVTSLDLQPSCRLRPSFLLVLLKDYFPQLVRLRMSTHSEKLVRFANREEWSFCAKTYFESLPMLQFIWFRSAQHTWEVYKR